MKPCQHPNNPLVETAEIKLEKLEMESVKDQPFVSEESRAFGY